MKKTIPEPKIGGIADKIAPIAALLGGILMVTGFVLAFTVAGLVNGATLQNGAVEIIGGVAVSNMLLFSQKIFYFHMPVAVVSFVALIFTGYYSIRYLMTSSHVFDVRAKAVTEIGLVFVMATMATGIMWTRTDWGVWWNWEPRLTTYFILMLMVMGYFILRNAIADEERRARYAAVLGILICVNVPICYFITRMIPSSLHPIVFRTDSGLPPDMLAPLLISLAGLLLFGFALYRLRLRTALMEEKLATIQEKMEA